MDSDYFRRGNDCRGTSSGSSPPLLPVLSSYPSPIREEASPLMNTSKRKPALGGAATEAAVEAAAEARERTRASSLIRYREGILFQLLMRNIRIYCGAIFPNNMLQVGTSRTRALFRFCMHLDFTVCFWGDFVPITRYLNRLSADPSEITTLLAQLPPDSSSFMQSHEFNEGCRHKFMELLQPGEDNLSSSAV